MASLALGVKFNPAAGGTTDFAYSSAVLGYVGPAASNPAMVDGKTYRYRAESADLSQWEFGSGVYTASTQTIARTTITLSSTGAKVSFTAPPQVGIIIFPADVLLFDDAMSLTTAQQDRGRSNIAVMGRNILINGDFRINQRLYVSAAALAAGAYGHDRWKAGATGGDYSFTQLKSSTQITIAASKTLIQVVEDVNVVGGNYVLSWAGTCQARVGLNSATPSGAFANSPILIAGQTAGTVMSVEFGNGAATGTLGTVQLEAGTAATPFEITLLPVELTKAQRYAWAINSTGAGEITTPFAGQCFSTTQALVVIPFGVSMRAAPTLTVSAVAHFELMLSNSARAVASVLSGQSLLPYGAVLTLTASGLVAGNATMIWTNSAAAQLLFSAEL